MHGKKFALRKDDGADTVIELFLAGDKRKVYAAHTYCWVFTSTTPRVVRRRVGITGRLMKDSVMNGSMSVPTPRAWAAFLASSRRVLTSRRELAADDAGNFQRKLGQHLPVLHDHDAASVPGNAVDGEGHVLVICADADDVVAVMGDGGGHRAGFQTVALEVADADVAGIFMPLYNGHFQNVLGHVHPSGVACVLGDDLPWHHADDAPQTGVGKVRGRKHRQVEGVVGALVQVFRDLGQGKSSTMPSW